MNVELPKKNKIDKKQLIIYISIILICAISILVAFYAQFYGRIDIAKMIGIGKEEQFGEKTQEEIQTLKTGFEDIFTNEITNDDGRNNNKKRDSDKPMVITGIEKKESKLNSYDIEVKIPYINIDNEIISKHNEEIEKTFVAKAKDILEKDEKNKNTIFTVEYVANIEYDILSLMIRSNLKEGANAQKVIIKTYNYDLRNNKEITLEEMLKIKQLDKQQVQERIRNEIELEQKRVEDLKSLGYNIYSRDAQSEEYNINAQTQSYMTKEAIYIIYAYGNEHFTSEKDVVII